MANCHNDNKMMLAVRSLLGVDIQEDNILECRQRLLNLSPGEIQDEAKKILERNIVVGDFLKHESVWFLANKFERQGSLSGWNRR